MENMVDTGYFGIGIYHPKKECNIGTLWRSAFSFGASFIFTVGERFKARDAKQSSDTTKAWRKIPYMRFSSFETLQYTFPDTIITGIEISDRATNLKDYHHPFRSIYLLGAEDHGIPENILDKCQKVVSINSKYCLNVSTTGSIVCYDRQVKQMI